QFYAICVQGWAATIRYHPTVQEEFARFRKRSDTLSFGVCNGCQLMAHLGWIGENVFGPVRIEQSASIWLKDMAGAVLGLWSSHGEGRFTYRDPKVLESLRRSGQIAVRYVDSDGQPSMVYPWNPNGSEDSVAAICSADGLSYRGNGLIIPETGRRGAVPRLGSKCSRTHSRG
ncbi:unnamed protein product, partial [Nippostrongylus brasiliensis]|uniref:Glutamine amidotransferase type-1 domain-containing protein n=1 Tax=Nippostrongylus brasiliensis TaxID=27835 RepID=A0A0N4YMB3_NIPBR